MIHFYSKSYRAGLSIMSFFFLLLFSLQANSQNTQLIINPGTFLTVNNGLVLNNADILANGTLDASQGALVFTGSSNTSVTAANTPVIKTFVLNKAVNSRVTLNHDVSVTGMIDFEQGLIDLNNQTLSLGNTGILSNETETSRITGTSGGWVTANASAVNNPSGLNIANLGAAITSNQNLDDVIISRTHKPAQNPVTGLTGIQRTFLIQPAYNTTLNATLRFYYFDAELNGKDENTLSLWTSTDGVTWTDAGITNRNTTDNYVEKKGLVSLGYFTLSDAENALPVTLVYFRAVCKDNYALIEWKTATEISTAHFDIQKSADAVNWVTIQSVAANNNSDGASYSYEDNNPKPTAYYRLRIVDQSGAYSYSPVFNGGCTDIAMPFMVYPNPAAGQAVARLSVRLATEATIQLFAINGQQIYNAQWSLQPGNNQFIIPLQSIVSGSYIVKVLVNKTVLQTKLIKQ